MQRAELGAGELRRAGGQSGLWGLAGEHKALTPAHLCFEGLAPSNSTGKAWLLQLSVCFSGITM